MYIHWLRTPVLIYFIVFFIIYQTSLSFAESELDEQRRLLQKGLTIHELNEEIARLEAKESDLNEIIAVSGERLLKQERMTQKQQEQAGKVLREIYTGERDDLWGALFSASSLSDALQIYELLDIILDQDQDTLEGYRKAYNKLKKAHDELLEAQQELRDTKSEFIAQRDRMLALVEELNLDLSNHPNAEQLKRQISALTGHWEQNGLPLFESYFAALAKAMKNLPDVIVDNNNLRWSGLNKVTMTLSDDELNAFLVEENSMFRYFQFEFLDGELVASGAKDNISISLRGHYKLIREPNSISFLIDELVYNGFVLPDTTAKALEEKFKLGFYPQKVMKNIEATKVEMTEGQLKVKLTVRLD